MEMTLLLNSTFEPLRVVHWQKAIALLWQGKVEVLEVYDREVHGVSISFKLPAVMRLLKLVRLKDSHRAVKFSRINIFTQRRLRLPVLSHQISHGRADVRSCGADRQGGAEDLGKHCDRLLAL